MSAWLETLVTASREMTNSAIRGRPACNGDQREPSADQAHLKRIPERGDAVRPRRAGRPLKPEEPLKRSRIHPPSPIRPVREPEQHQEGERARARPGEQRPGPRGHAIQASGADPAREAVATIAAPRPPSSRGLGRRPLTAETGVRIPVAVLARSPLLERASALWRPRGTTKGQERVLRRYAWRPPRTEPTKNPRDPPTAAPAAPPNAAHARTACSSPWRVVGSVDGPPMAGVIGRAASCSVAWPRSKRRDILFQITRGIGGNRARKAHNALAETAEQKRAEGLLHD